MISSIVDLIVQILKSIPFFDKWFTKTELEKENEKKQQVDKEQDSNQNTKRPSDDFWKNHGGL